MQTSKARKARKHASTQACDLADLICEGLKQNLSNYFSNDLALTLISISQGKKLVINCQYKATFLQILLDYTQQSPIPV